MMRRRFRSTYMNFWRPSEKRANLFQTASGERPPWKCASACFKVRSDAKNCSLSSEILAKIALLRPHV